MGDNPLIKWYWEEIERKWGNESSIYLEEHSKNKKGKCKSA